MVVTLLGGQDLSCRKDSNQVHGGLRRREGGKEYILEICHMLHIFLIIDQPVPMNQKRRLCFLASSSFFFFLLKPHTKVAGNFMIYFLKK